MRQGLCVIHVVRAQVNQDQRAMSVCKLLQKFFGMIFSPQGKGGAAKKSGEGRKASLVKIQMMPPGAPVPREQGAGGCSDA